ncbi:UNVERIFIED_CONTAM: hypothetical protein K2H54_017257 [Gekko kuhli]
MGLLSQGSPLSWEETQKHAEHVRKHGILQFLHIYRAVRERHKDVLKWGDEDSEEVKVYLEINLCIVQNLIQALLVEITSKQNG